MGNKHKSKHKKKGSVYSSKLTNEEKYQYDRIGAINYDQDHLELFNDEVTSKLWKINKSDDSNQDKADRILKFLSKYGFVEIDLGTNIFVMAHHKYPGVVFKIALDEYGVTDNFNDEWLKEYVPELPEVIALHNSGIVSAQERKVVIRSSQRMRMFMYDALRILKRLSKQFVLADISPLSFKNYCINRDGTLGLVDASDLFPIPENYNIFKCRNIVDVNWKGRSIHCGGTLEYDDIYHELVCKKCGKRYNPLTLRRSKKEVLKMPVICTGLTKDEWDELNEIGLRIIEGGLTPEYQNQNPTKSNLKVVTPDEDDEEVEVIKSASVNQSGYLDDSGDVEVDDSDEEESEDTSVEVVNVRGENSVTTVETVDEEAIVLRRKTVDTVTTSPAPMINPSVGDKDTCVVSLDHGPIINVCLQCTEDKVGEILRDFGPDIYISLDGGSTSTKIITSDVFAALLERGIEQAKDEGLWFD